MKACRDNDAKPHADAAQQAAAGSGHDLMKKRLLTLGFGTLKLRTLRSIQKPRNGRCSWVCIIEPCLSTKDRRVLLNTYGVGSSLLVSDRRVSSKTSELERATVRFHAFRALKSYPFD